MKLQTELAQRDFIVLCQFSLSHCTPFARLARKYLVQTFKLFPPIFFKEKVLLTLSFTIDFLMKKLNINYSNMSEVIKFPFYNQEIMGIYLKSELSKALAHILSVATNLYFLAFTHSRYLAKSGIENFLRTASNSNSSSDSQSIAKQYFSLLYQIEPELKNPLEVPNYFLTWLKDIQGFHKSMSFDHSISKFKKLVCRHSSKKFFVCTTMKTRTSTSTSSNMRCPILHKTRPTFLRISSVVAFLIIKHWSSTSPSLLESLRPLTNTASSSKP